MKARSQAAPRRESSTFSRIRRTPATRCGKVEVSRRINRESEFCDQITGFDVHRFGNSQQCVQADPLFATFDLANVNGMKIGFFGQLLLA